MLQHVVESLGLPFFAAAGLGLFLLVFVAVAIGAARRSQSEVDRLASLALEPDEQPENGAPHA